MENHKADYKINIDVAKAAIEEKMERKVSVEEIADTIGCTATHLRSLREKPVSKPIAILLNLAKLAGKSVEEITEEVKK